MLHPVVQEHYLNRLDTDQTEYDALLGAILINTSSFFRNPIVFELIAREVLPQLLGRRLRRR